MAATAMPLLVALVAGLGSASPSPAPTVRGAVYAATTTAELVGLLKRVRGGERILLAPGVYPPFSLRAIAPSSTVTIASRDPARAAVLTGVHLRDGGNLAFRDLVFRSSGTSVQEGFLLHGMHNVSMHRIFATGRTGPLGLSRDKILQLRECIGITITGSEFTHAYIALSLLDTTNVSVTASYFHDLRMDAIRGGGNSNVRIAYNYLSGFSPQGTDHPDAIQFWTARQSKAAHDIQIVGNVILRGKGSAMQGIFLRDETGGLAYRAVQIADNLVVGSMYNGIAVLSDSDSVRLSKNVVSAYPDQKSWIRVGSRATLDGNVAPLYLVGGKRVDMLRNNHIAGPGNASSALRTWVRGRALDRYPESLRYHVDGL